MRTSTVKSGAKSFSKAAANERFCFWSIAGGSNTASAQRLVDSARRVGVFKDFHLWTDGLVNGAICHRLTRAETRERLVQLWLLQEDVRKLKYEYFVWLEANNLFVRHPGDLLRVLHGAPVHASFESDAALPDPQHPDWGICSLSNFTKLMRFKGVRSRGIFTLNGGFWIVHRDVIENFYALAWDFWDFCKRLGYSFGFEHLLAYATQMLCGNPYLHTLKHNSDVWALDRVGRYEGVMPPSGGWDYVDYFSGETFRVRPAIVQVLPGPGARVGRSVKQVRAARSGVTAGL